MKRFYRQASVGRDENGHTVLLDGRPVRTPAKAPLRVEQERLARALAAEWHEQGEEIDPATLRLGRLVNTAIDLTAMKMADVRDEILKFAETDLLCYRAAGPAELIRRQTRHWQPLLDWAAARYGVSLVITDGVLPVGQPPHMWAVFGEALTGLPPLELTGLHQTVALCGSLILGLAVLEQRVTSDEAWQAAFLEELYQAEIWGDDEEAAGRRERTRQELRTASELLALCRRD